MTLLKTSQDLVAKIGEHVLSKPEVQKVIVEKVAGGVGAVALYISPMVMPALIAVGQIIGVIVGTGLTLAVAIWITEKVKYG